MSKHQILQYSKMKFENDCFSKQISTDSIKKADKIEKI